MTDFTYPTLCWYFGETNTSLMQADVAHTAKNNKVIVSVITISTDLALCVFILTLAIIINTCLIFCYFLSIEFFSVFFHVLKILFFIWVKLKNKFKQD